MQSGEDNQKVNVKMLEPITPTFSILPPSSIISRNSAVRNSSNTAKTSAANAAAMKKLKAKPAYFSFPAQLTEEERMLQNKYKQLKKKQIAAEKMKIAPTRGHCVVESDPKAPTKRSKSPQIGARDAREIAKKLVKSGAIKIDKVPTISNEGFKRSLGLERKLNTFEKSIGYQPFSATIMEGYGESTGKIFRKSRPEQPLTGPSGTDPVANSSDHQEKPFANEEDARAPCLSGNERGPTLYVSGESLTEDYLRELFMSYGNIIHVILVHNKKNAFVKLDSEEASHRAVRELNGSTFKDVQIEVALARRRLVFNNHRWAGLPEVMDFDKTEEQRSIISYDDI